MRDHALAEILAAAERSSAADYVAWLEARAEAEPRCALTHYVLGCQYYDRGRFAQAVRQMMPAHHLDPSLESAALLVFTGLNLVRRRSGPILKVLLETWRDYSKPPFDRFASERHVLDAFAEPTRAIAGATPLVRHFWRLPIRTLRQELTAAVASADAGQYSLLFAPG